MGSLNTFQPEARLSNLKIDTDKDWAGREIKNLGNPTTPSSAVRKDIVVKLIMLGW